MSGPESQAQIITPTEIAKVIEHTPAEMAPSDHASQDEAQTQHALYEVAAEDQEASIGFVRGALSKASEVLDSTRPGILNGRKLATGAAVALSAFTAAKSSGLINPDSASASKNVPTAGVAQIEQRKSSLKTQTVINKIYKVLQPYSGGYTQGNSNRRVRHKGKLIYIDKIIPKSAFLQPSLGGYKTDCENPYVNTFRNYYIGTNGQGYATCKFLGVWPKKIKENEFQIPQNKIGAAIQKSVRLPGTQSTKSIVASRKQVTANYECRDDNTIDSTDNLEVAQNPSNASKIVLKRVVSTYTGKRRETTKAIIYPC